MHTFDKMSVSELIRYHKLYLKKIQEFERDTPDYNIVVIKLEAIESLLRKKRPSYFIQKEEEIFESIYDKNYTLQQAGSILNVSRQTLVNWGKKNLIKVIKVGSKSYIPKIELDKVTSSGTI